MSIASIKNQTGQIANLTKAISTNNENTTLEGNMAASVQNLKSQKGCVHSKSIPGGTFCLDKFGD
jgi:hypothetical protein